ncbi:MULTISPECIES: YbhB/YbcL family Raf kinase inhibitor-like protein [unclassified Pseudactinotalea]|uniref:YbhB/YbcL family Raf kinase inhibitor-like protein n=1 Tax=unclassified Pseudactinotalea TaxID=2649176 RepID=UPI003C7ACD07
MDLSRPLAPNPYDLLPATGSFTLTSPDITDGTPLAESFTEAGGNISPALSWSGFPEETQSFLINCFDPDAPNPAGYWHWSAVDIPVQVTSLEQGAGESDLGLPGAAFHVRSDGGTFGYEGAAPPPGDHPHRYIFAVHALDTETLDLSSEHSPTKVAFTALFHTLARATLVPTYQRP